MSTAKLSNGLAARLTVLKCSYAKSNNTSLPIDNRYCLRG